MSTRKRLLSSIVKFINHLTCAICDNSTKKTRTLVASVNYLRKAIPNYANNGFSKGFNFLHFNRNVNRSLTNVCHSQRYLSNTSDVKCWNCRQYLERKKINCSLCGALQYPKENVNFFELFGVTQAFEMDLDLLSTKFKNLQMTFHPDKFVNKSKKELEISDIYSRLINKAYATLKDPVKRGLYLLELRNLSMSDTFPIGQEFLTAIMEKNEELEHINSENNLENFKRTNREEISKQIELVSQSFHFNNWEEAKCNLMKLNYLINLDVKIKGKQSELLSLKEK